MNDAVIEAAQKWVRKARRLGSYIQTHEVDIDLEGVLVAHGWPVINDPIQTTILERRLASGEWIVRIILESGISINIPI